MIERLGIQHATWQYWTSSLSDALHKSHMTAGMQPVFLHIDGR
jgi:hypothetical protein